jgi:hypothetical protein
MRGGDDAAPQRRLGPIGRVSRLGRRVGAEVKTSASLRTERCAGTLADGRLAAGSDDQR